MYWKYAGAKRANTSISGRDSCFTMKRSSAPRRSEQDHPRQQQNPQDLPSVFMKSTLDFPPAASHLRQRARLSMNCVPQPHCWRSASNCSTQKTVQRAEMSPSSTSARRCQRRGQVVLKVDYGTHLQV